MLNFLSQWSIVSDEEKMIDLYQSDYPLLNQPLLQVVIKVVTNDVILEEP